MKSREDPMERLIREALESTGEIYLGENENDCRLDFYLPRLDVYIEVKQFHSDRIAVQLAKTKNVIVAQGRPAVEALAGLIRSGLK